VRRTLLHYNILEKLGEGGMGVVWKARDTHLDRFVAVKVLPVEKLKDTERQRRFVQEAKAASALNHPNIVHIYDIAEAEGTPFIAMEYVAGKTLDQTIGRKGLRVSEVLRYSVQIADALEKAHTAGIVHRNLKPSNIMVTADGLVKILDFGLAKLTEPASGDFGETRTVREAGAATEEGAIVRTVAYMSPEQAEGKEVDGRSDIFSFGAVLYEMVRGRRAFQGDSKLSTLSAILKEEPGALPPEVARDLDKIIVRCLRRDPARRFQHADDLKVALLELKEESDSSKIGVPDKAGATTRRARTWAPALAVLLLVVGIGTWTRFRALRALRATPKTVFLTSYPGRQRAPALSPDGKQVAFSWDGEKGDNFDIYVKLVDGGTPLRLTANPAIEGSPAWSPDGGRVAFFRVLGSTADILLIPSLGGQERRLGHVVLTPELNPSLSWSPDGKFLAVSDRSPDESASICFVSTETREKRRMTLPPREYSGDSLPSFSPDGKTLAFVRTRSNFTNDIYVLRPTSGGSAAAAPRRITSGPGYIQGLDWTRDGRGLVFSLLESGGLALRMIPADGGVPEPLMGVGEGGTKPSVSRHSNRLAYERPLGDSNIWRISGPRSNQRTGPPEKWIASTLADAEPQYSPDGKKIVFSSSRSGTQELWTADSNDGEPTQLTSFGGPLVGSPRWSPDSRWIAFDASTSDNSHIFVISADGGRPRQFTQGSTNNVRPSWSSDGKWIYFGSNRSGEWQVWKAPGRGGDALQVTKGGGREAFESLDGKLLFYSKYQKEGIWSVPAEGGAEAQVLQKAGQSIWAVARDGICFFDWKDAVHPVVEFYNFRDRRLTTLYEFSRGTLLDRGGRAISISPDERWILYTQIDQAGSNLVLVENFQ
jgi:Tol biopolymer transport system component